MVGNLLTRGMLVGLLAGALNFGFLKVVGEPQVDRAIAFESQMDAARTQAAIQEALAKGQPAPQAEPEPELVSRPTQAGIGLLTGVLVYSAAFGGLFALAFAFIYGRLSGFGARGTAALLGLAGLISVYVIPNLKYPANPPSIGNPDTIGMRTAWYFAMIVVSLAAMLSAAQLQRRLRPRQGVWNATLIGAAVYIAIVVAAGLLLPAINEVPTGFPADLLWKFRMASLGAQVILWTTLGIGFGLVNERVVASRTRRPFAPHHA